MRKVATLIVVGLLAVGCTSAFAGSFTSFNSDSGWYDQFGVHDQGNTNYYSGNHFDDQLNNWFVFSLAGITGNITSAQFNVFSYGIDVSGTYTIYATALGPSITNGCSGGPTCVAIYNALTSGPAIGSINFTPANALQELTINLNSAGLAFLNSHEGSTIVIGGSNPQPYNGADNYIFGFSGFTPTNSLTITTSNVPEPASLFLLGSSLLGAGSFARKRLKKA